MSLILSWLYTSLKQYSSQGHGIYCPVNICSHCSVVCLLKHMGPTSVVLSQRFFKYLDEHTLFPVVRPHEDGDVPGRVEKGQHLLWFFVEDMMFIGTNILANDDCVECMLLAEWNNSCKYFCTLFYPMAYTPKSWHPLDSTLDLKKPAWSQQLVVWCQHFCVSSSGQIMHRNAAIVCIIILCSWV